MTKLSGGSVDTLKAMARKYRQGDAPDTPGRYTAEQSQPQWYYLIEDLEPGGQASAQRCTWSASGNEGDGERTPDEEQEVIVRSTVDSVEFDAGAYVLARRIGSANGPVFEVLPFGATQYFPCVIRVYNYGDLSAKTAGAVVGLWSGGSVHSPSEELQAFGSIPTSYYGEEPATDKHEQNAFAVLLQDLGGSEGDVAIAAIAGACAVQLRVTDNDHTRAKIADGEYYLESCADGEGDARILWHETVSTPPDTVWALVRLGGGGGATSDDSVPFQAKSGETVPQYGVICAYDTTCASFYMPTYTDLGTTDEYGFIGGMLRYYQYGSGYEVRFAREYFVNTGGEVASGDRGRASPCTTKIHLAAYNSSTGTPAAGEIWGPAPGTYTLHRGLPGFIVYGPVDTSAHTVGVMRDMNNTPIWCRATENWTHGGDNYEATVRVNPMSIHNAAADATFAYDGSHKSPRIDLIIGLPCGDQPAVLASMHSPNVVAGNCFGVIFADGKLGGVGWYFKPSTSWYIDEPIGTIRMTAVTVTVPQGWAIMNGSANASGNGGSGIDMRDRIPAYPGGSVYSGGAGGSANHTHGIVAGSGIAAGNDLATTTGNQSALPPYYGLAQFLERLDNGL